MELDAFDLFNFKTNIKIQEEFINEGFEIVHNSCDTIKSIMEFTVTYKNIYVYFVFNRNSKNIPCVTFALNSEKFVGKFIDNTIGIDLNEIKSRIDKIANKLQKEKEEKEKVESTKRAVIFKLGMVQAFIEAELQKHFNDWVCYKSDDGSMIISFTVPLIRNDRFTITLSPPRSREDFIDKELDKLNFKIDYDGIYKKYSYTEFCIFLSNIHTRFDILKTERDRILELATEIKEEEEKLAKAKKELRTLEIKTSEHFENSIKEILRSNKQQQVFKEIECQEEDDNDDDDGFFAKLKGR